jgi:hypothetical protein
MQTIALKDVLFQLISGNIDTNPVIAQLLPGGDDAIPENDTSAPGGSRSFEEHQLIDLLSFTDEPRILLMICADLAERGTVFSLPALIAKLDAKDRDIRRQANAAIKKIAAREGLNRLSLGILKDPAFRKAKWNKTALHFLAFYSIICSWSGVELENVESDQMADLLVTELGIDLDVFTCFKEFRICHLETDQYFQELQRIHEHLTIDSLIDSELTKSEIIESEETVLNAYYCELINAFLNVKLIELFKSCGGVY